MDDIQIGQFLDNRYEILEKIGTGGMSVVYKARCHRLNRFVAIKVLKSELAENEELRRRFHAESQAVAMLSHPNIVAVYDVNHTDNVDYIVMELIEGKTLKEYINLKGILHWKEALHFTIQIVKALGHAHYRGIIHRDIKPHNIMIQKDGSVKVADFGIARLLSTQSTMTQEALGSVHYISPEQAKGGQVDARSDLYSLGVVMYEMLTGRLPFEGDSAVSVAIQHISSIPLQPREINPDIPVGLAQITMHAMEPNLDLRYPTAAAMLQDLEEFRKNPSVEFEYPSVPVPENTESGPVSRLLRRGGQEGAKRYPGNALSRDKTSDEEYRKNREKAERTTMLVGTSLVAVFVIAVFWFLLLPFINSILAPNTARVAVDSFTGKNINDIISNPEYTKIYKFVVNDLESDTVDKGIVISQNPAAERTVSPGEGGTVEVTLDVSKGAREVFMPDVTNKDYREVQSIFEQLDFGLKVELQGEPDDSITRGYVMETIPEAETRLVRNMTITVIYSTGPEIVTVAVPEVTGFSLNNAIARLQSYDLSYEVQYDYSDTYDENIVSFQGWPAGEEVPIHSVIYLTVSLGPRPADAPDNGAVG